MEQNKSFEPIIEQRETHISTPELQDTPVMGQVDMEHAEALSLRSAHPPLKIAGYEQEQFLGRGAFGEVWKAVDCNSGREVAIKFYSHRGGLDWSHMTREVEKLQYLFSDRYVVQLFDVGWDADPPYYVMEYMAFGSLEDRLREGPMSVAEAVKTIREVAVGLAHAHDKGILHCDLKPGNIMLDQDGRPRLADFGQARLKHEHAPALGTLFYMAPEQADMSAVPDARWDVYALGAMLYRMITGELPYLNDENSKQLSSQTSLDARLKCYSGLAASQQKPVAHRLHPSVDKSLAEIIDKCLAVDRRKRHPNVQTVLNALDLRETRRSQRPMLLLGLVGPSLIIAIMALVAWMLFQKTIETASTHLLQRTGESNHFAALSVAERFGLEVDKRWRILEQESVSPDLHAWLKSDSKESKVELQTWLEQKHRLWNSQFSAGTGAAYWFVLDKDGKVRALSPTAGTLIGSYFGYREYFHGQGRELSPFDPVPSIISRPHRSTIFRSQPTNQLAVAFSVPILSASGQTLGIIAMETAMGKFAEFQGSRNQLAVLVDLKQDQAGQAGLIVEHPALNNNDHRGQSTYLSAEQFKSVQQICRNATHPQTPDNEVSTNTIIQYHDPLDDNADDTWLASIAPVKVLRGDNDVRETDWAIIVQEQTQQTLSPLVRVRRLFIVGGLIALVLAALIVGGLWWIVLTIANPAGRLRLLRFWNRPTTLHSETTTGASAHKTL
ncbi:MAG: protein kinase [Planctomycetales bacterium]|nr:protein kinase [Planctomycetales bacterium]